MSDIKFKTEVVVNTTYGGFALSDEARALIKERKKLFGMSDIHVYDLPRNDPVLVGVVKDLAEKAGGAGCKLKVIEVDLTVEVRSYDGKETVHVGGNEFV